MLYSVVPQAGLRWVRCGRALISSVCGVECSAAAEAMSGPAFPRGSMQGGGGWGGGGSGDGLANKCHSAESDEICHTIITF